jgi:superfamily II DNA or RNA helicase
MEPSFNPALEAQAVGRVMRLGQKRNVEIVRLVIADSFETRMVQFLEKKYGLSFETSTEDSEPDSEDNHVSENDDSDDQSSEDETQDMRKPVATRNQVAPADVSVGNLKTDKTTVMIEEFDLLFGVEDLLHVQDRKLQVESTMTGLDSKTADDDDAAPDAVMSWADL